MDEEPKPTDGFPPLSIVHKHDGKIDFHATLRYGDPDDTGERTVVLECRCFKGEVELLDRGGRSLSTEMAVLKHEDSSLVTFREKVKRAQRSFLDRKRVLPTCIAELATLPEERCGIATYTKWLSGALDEHYPTCTYRDIDSGVPENALIHAQVEFGIFPDPEMLHSKKYLDNYKLATWHTVLKNPHQHQQEYVYEIDDHYDAHIVHTVLQKLWLSRFVKKPIYLIPHGTLMWDPIDKREARRRLGIDPEERVAFCYGFAAESKGFDEVLRFASQVFLPKFRLYVSGGVHGIIEEHTKKEIKRLQKFTGEKAVLLGRWLTEEETDLWVSAADILVFNYRTPDFIASASGAMHRVLASGKPIVCVDDNRLEELVNGQHCIKFPPGDEEEFVAAVELILEDEEIARKLGDNCRLLAENTSWKRIAERHMEVFGKVVGEAYDASWYDESYFVGSDGGKVFTEGGEVKRWSYYNPVGEWLGCAPIMKAIKELMDPSTVLDAGCGRGTFCVYGRDEGMECIGVDFSEWAVSNPYPGAVSLIRLGDVRDLEFQDRSFDLVFASDLMEHIYMEDLDQVISELRRVADRYIFFNIGGTTDGEEMIISKGELPRKDRVGTSIAGHVTVKSCDWWRERLGSESWRLREDLVRAFRERVPAEVLANWNCVLIYERSD
ncbi:MAG: methyltransferase domain-containing protein [Methanoculleus sp.]